MIGRLRISDLEGESIFGRSPRKFRPSERMPGPDIPVWRMPGRGVSERPSYPRGGSISLVPGRGVSERPRDPQIVASPLPPKGMTKIITRPPDFNGAPVADRKIAGGGGISRIRQREMGLSDAVAVAAPAVSAAAPGGFWANIGSALSNVVSGVLPVVAQVQAQKYLAKQQGQLLQTQGNVLYTPQNIRTLQSQAEFEAAQRQVDFGRQTGAMGLPISGTTLAIIGGAGLLVYLATRKK